MAGELLRVERSVKDDEESVVRKELLLFEKGACVVEGRRDSGLLETGEAGRLIVEGADEERCVERREDWSICFSLLMASMGNCASDADR